MEKNPVFITGGTGYIGKRLIRILLEEGFEVTALIRATSLKKLPPGCSAVIADPFDANSYVKTIPENSIFIHLLGVSHPGPKKKLLFYSVDLASLKMSVEAAKRANSVHFVYVSVAQFPTKIMADYQEERRQGEQAVLGSGIPSIFIRPWYVTGPGHYWPLFLQPAFKLLELIPSTSIQAKSLALVSLRQMLAALKQIIINRPPEINRIVEVEDIKKIKP